MFEHQGACGLTSSGAQRAYENPIDPFKTEKVPPLFSGSVPGIVPSQCFNGLLVTYKRVGRFRDEAGGILKHGTDWMLTARPETSAPMSLKSRIATLPLAGASPS